MNAFIPRRIVVLVVCAGCLAACGGDDDSGRKGTSPTGAETNVTRHTGCRPGGSVEFWEMVGSGHYLFPTDEFRRIVVDYFFSHPKP
jgi:ABC-type glycerol-3-phosphate transport system substrate-binding protein